MKNRDTEVTYEIIKEIGVVSESSTGWQKILTVTSWCGREPRLDLREWSPDRQKCTRGLTLDRDQAASLMKLLQSELQ